LAVIHEKFLYFIVPILVKGRLFEVFGRCFFGIGIEGDPAGLTLHAHCIAVNNTLIK